MKTTAKITLVAIVITFNFLLSTFNAVAQNVNIPNANFKAALVGNSAINTNLDGEIQTSEAAVFTGTINVNSSNIADLTGIEAFTALTFLYCGNNQLTSLDVSANTALFVLNCGSNQLTNLDVSANTALTLLNCSDNQLTSLDVSANTALDNLSCGINQLTNLDVSANTALGEFECNNNQLTNLDIRNGNNTNLFDFSAINNPSLICILVDNAAYMNTNWASGKDAGAIYSENCSVGINEVSNNFVSIYPNPTSGTISVILDTSNELVSYTVLTIDSKIVEEGQSTENTIKIDLQNNNKGIYFLKIIGENTSKTFKVIKE